ncbi:MAG: UTP--glucose-1-phosphate uridylyltransferase GalU [Proteobacteria bacterium]|nr:UTP--glucose-1-phosphate uridylyltransferase GalU [Pseudomonadota bacterium]
MMNKKINAAVFPVAGLGSRFLPATKATPKEMLPIVDKPLIQYAVEEAFDAGIKKMIFVTGRNKRAIEDHFDSAYELETELALKEKHELLTIVQSVAPKGVEFVYVRQSKALGLGHAILCAKPALSDEPFAVLLADDLIRSSIGALQQLIMASDGTNRPIIGLEEIQPHQTSAYGVILIREPMGKHVIASNLVEKPKPENAPSNLGVVGRYILPYEIFDVIAKLPNRSGGEIQLTDALAVVAQRDGVIGVLLEGRRFDCGSKLGFAQANIEYGLEHPEIGENLKAYLKALVG